MKESMRKKKLTSFIGVFLISYLVIGLSRCESANEVLYAFVDNRRVSEPLQGYSLYAIAPTSKEVVTKTQLFGKVMFNMVLSNEKEVIYYLTREKGLATINTSTNKHAGSIVPIEQTGNFLSLDALAVDSKIGISYLLCRRPEILPRISSERQFRRVEGISFDLKTNQVTHRFNFGEERIENTFLKLSQDSSRIYCLKTNGTLLIFQAPQWVKIKELHLGNVYANPERKLIYSTTSSDGGKIFITEPGDQAMVWIIDTTSDEVTKIDLGYKAYFRGIAMSPDNSRLYLGEMSYLSVVDLATNKVIARVAEDCRSIAVSHDGGKLYFISGDGISIMDVATLKVIDTIDIPAYFLVMTFTP